VSSVVFDVWLLQLDIVKLILWFSISGVIGCIDGSHIPIRAPHDSPSSYVNRRGFHSILLQAVCDHELRFLDCYAGEVGSIHDACMLHRSDFMEKLNNDAFFQVSRMFWVILHTH
jgi:DDE superfamily endonuclease